MKKKNLSPYITIALIALLFSCKGKSSLEFDKVKFNTPMQVIDALGIDNLPTMNYVGNTTNAEFNWDYWDCLVEFQFEDTLSIKEKEIIIQYARGKDKFQWIYEGLPKEGVVEFFNIKYEESDTIPYNIVITNDKLYVAYKDKVVYSDFSDWFGSNEYHLIAEKNFLVGIDTSHEYAIKFKRPYLQYIDKLKTDKSLEYKETAKTITITKDIYANDDSTILQAKYEIVIDKQKNVAIIKYGTF